MPLHYFGNCAKSVSFRCKAFLHDKYFGQVRIVVGYAQLKPASKLWISGLTRRSSATEIFQIFSSFGEIVDIDGRDGEFSRHITFARVEEAQAALTSIRTHGLTGHFRNVVVDFAANSMTELVGLAKLSASEDREEPLEEGECTPEAISPPSVPVPPDYTSDSDCIVSAEIQLGKMFSAFLLLLKGVALICTDKS